MIFISFAEAIPVLMPAEAGKKRKAPAPKAKANAKVKAEKVRGC